MRICKTPLLRGRHSIAASLLAGWLSIGSGEGIAACTGPATQIDLNQVGFFSDGPKRAVISSVADSPIDWQLQGASGQRLMSGTTVAFGPDAASGHHVHQADFSDFRGTGRGLRLTVDCGASDEFDVDPDPYGRLPKDALSFFYHSRSGIRIEADLAGGRAWARRAGHRKDRATCRQGVDNHGNTWPGCDYRLTATGGWYDAADHGKYVVTGAASVWTLLNLYERQRATGGNDIFGDGRHAIPETGNGVNDLLDEARWELEFLLRMQAPPGARARVPVNATRAQAGLQFTEIDASGMAHHDIADERWTPVPTPPDRDRQLRVLAPVSTAATLDLAAVAAQCARIWRTVDRNFSDRCLAAATTAFAAAERNPQVYFVADFPGSGMYADADVSDEFFWAAAELFVTTGDEKHAAALRASPFFARRLRGEPSWSRTEVFGMLTLAAAPGALEQAERETQRRRIVNLAERFHAERARSGYGIPYAATAYPWGSNSMLLNRAIVLGTAFDLTGDAIHRDAVIDVIDYLLGRNPLGRSYVAGYGDRPVMNVHHRFWAASLDSNLPPPPPGALSGGPNSSNPADDVARSLTSGGCAPQTCWRDDPSAFSLNEVAINWNAPLVWAAAFLDRTAQTR